jgi:hypothetical protein
MKMTRMMIQLPRNLKTKLDALRKQGATASGLMRNQNATLRSRSATALM